MFWRRLVPHEPQTRRDLTGVTRLPALVAHISTGQFTLLQQFDFAWSPSLVEERFERAVEP